VGAARDRFAPDAITATEAWSDRGRTAHVEAHRTVRRQLEELFVAAYVDVESDPQAGESFS
jgi:hypothetical protein